MTTTDNDDAGHDFTILATGLTGLLDRFVLVRREDGRLVRVTVPVGLSRPADLAAAIDIALRSIPDRPGRNVY